MNYRPLGRTGYSVSEISFGAWAIGGTWGKVDDSESMKALHAAIDSGVNTIDTADVYGDGHSERLIAQLKKDRKGEQIYVFTKAGRRLNPHNDAGYNKQNLSAFMDRSLKNLQTDCLDLVQLHCPPTETYSRPDIYGAMDELVKEGKLCHWGVSVEKVSEAMTAIEHPSVQSVQIIFNLFRTKPAEQFFPKAKEKKVGILARVPLASGLLTGKMSKQSTFEKDDHRNFNRHGEAFDVGETFSGVDFDKGLQAVDQLKPLVPSGATLAQFALRWILMHDAVTCAIPGAKTVEQAKANVAAADLPAIDPAAMKKADAIYDQFIRADVHGRW